MAGIGLGWSAGNDAMAQNIRQQIADQLMAEQRKKQDAQQAFENDLRTKQFQSGEDMKRAQLDALTANRGNEQEDRLYRRAGDVAEQVPAGTALPMDSPDVGLLNKGGRGALLSPQPDTVDAPPSALAANPDAGPQTLPGTIANAPSPMVGRLVIKGATQKQNEAGLADTRKQTEIDSKSADADAKLAHLQDIASQAWERLRLQGDSNEARATAAGALAQFHQAQLERDQAKAEAEKSKTPQPQYMLDANGATHAVIFKDGKLTEVPLPAGFTPTKAAPPGFFDKLRGLWGGSSTPAAPASGNPTDPNWGK